MPKLKLVAALCPLALLAACQQPAAAPTVSAQALSAEPTLDVLTWNIQFLPAIAGTTNAPPASPRVAGIIDQLENGELSRPQPDVLVLEEAFENGAQQQLSRELRRIGYRYQTPVVGRVCTGGGWASVQGHCSTSPVVVNGGTFLASRYPIARADALIYRNSVMWTADYYANKGALHAAIQKGGRQYHLIGTHLQADTQKNQSVARLKQVGEWNAWLSSLNIPQSEPVIIAGDLNAPMREPATWQGAAPTVDTHLLDPDAGSYVAAQNNLALFGASGDCHYNERLDHVLWLSSHAAPTQGGARVWPLESRLAAISWAPLNTYAPCHGPATAVTTQLSDHFPVRAQLGF